MLPYLGKPGAMQALPSPNGPIDSAPSRGDNPVTLLSGGQSVVRRLHQRRTYNLPFLSLEPGDADQILGFYQGLYGSGPYVFVDASVRNVLGLDVSTCGVRTQASAGWVKTSGTLTASGAATSPVLGSGVLTWATPASGASLHPGLVALTANTKAAPVYLPTEAVTVSMWLKCSHSRLAHAGAERLQLGWRVACHHDHDGRSHHDVPALLGDHHRWLRRVRSLPVRAAAAPHHRWSAHILHRRGAARVRHCDDRLAARERVAPRDHHLHSRSERPAVRLLRPHPDPRRGGLMLASTGGFKTAVEGVDYTIAEVITLTLPGGIYSDVTLAASSVQISASTTTDLPDQSRMQVGYPKITAQFTLSGQVDQTDETKTAAWLFRRWSATSPLYRTDALHTPVTIDIGLYPDTAGGTPEPDTAGGTPE
jgi:hypothetical protein